MASDGIPLCVKWGKETLHVKLIVDGGVKGLKAELEEQTGVPADRMKLMPKSKGLWKGVLKDEFDLSSIDFSSALSKNGGKELQVLLMGSPATKLAAPKTKTVFLEDLPPEEAAKASAVEPSGLVNVGNTCYLNSVVQCLRAVTPLRRGLASFTPNNNNNINQANNLFFLNSLKELFSSLDATAHAVTPYKFVSATRMSFPQFAQTGNQGQPMQQDAEEFYSGLLTLCASETSGKAHMERALPGVTQAELGGATNMVDALFGIQMQERLVCDDDTTEAPVESFDLHRKLVCNIQGGGTSSTTNVNHIAEGIQLSLNGKIEKRSDVLGRDAVWSRQQRMARLPPVLCVQFGRFYWKQTPDSQDHAGVKCKVMKPVTFTGTLDVYDFCTADIQKVLKVARDKALAAEEDRIAKKLKGELQQQQDDEKMDVEEKNDDDTEKELQAAIAMSMQQDDNEQQEDQQVLASPGPGLPPDFQGLYELFAVVTHKGRDADGGHYMGWVKAASNDDNQKVQKIADTNEDNEDWFVFDDDEVSPCKTEDVLKLKGGGDWHMSYLNFYRAKK